MRILGFLVLCTSMGLTAAGPVLLMSFDGLAATQFTARTMPRFWQLSRQGQRGEGVPPAPCTTFNGHATLATGCWPEHHGIVANGFLDPATGPVNYGAQAQYLDREPLWVAATRSGVRAAVYHWPCATGPWQGVTPWRMEAFRKDTPDSAALAFSEKALKEGAGLVMTYISGTDLPGHRNGPGSAATRRQLAALDAAIAPWIRRMRAAHPGLRILLLADHGMASMGHGIAVLPLLAPGAKVVAHGGSAFAYLPGPLDPATAAQLTALGLHLWRREDVPASFHLAGNARMGNLVLEAPLGSWISDAATPEGRSKEQEGRQGAHGYVSDHRAMHTWLVALGTGSRAPLPPVALWDVAPTIAKWLDIHWAATPDGLPVAALN